MSFSALMTTPTIAVVPVNQPGSMTVGEVIEAFLQDKLARMSPNSCARDNFDEYERVLENFMHWRGATTPVSACAQAELYEWARTVNGWTVPLTRCQAGYRVCVAFRWAVDAGMIPYAPYAPRPKTDAAWGDYNPRPRAAAKPVAMSSAARVSVREGKRQRKRLPKRFPWKDAERLLAWCNEQVGKATRRKRAAAERDMMFIHLGLFAGLRVSEMADLQIEHVDLAQKQIFVALGKGGKDRYLPIPDRLFPVLKKYIGKRESGLLIPSRAGVRLCIKSIHYRIVRAGKLAGLTQHLHCHLLRHGYAQRLLETGADIRTVQDLLGHSQLQQTATYLSLDTSRHVASVNRL